jgi:hypothetical protein
MEQWWNEGVQGNAEEKKTDLLQVQSIHQSEHSPMTVQRTQPPEMWHGSK